MGSDTYYQLLSLQSTASFDEIKRRYRKLSLLFHPDRGGSERQMIKLNEAYRVLSNPLTRREYDAKIRSPQSSHASSQNTYKESTVGSMSQKTNRLWWWLGSGVVAALGFLIYEAMPVLQASHQNINPGYTIRSQPSYPESASLQPTTTTSTQSDTTDPNANIQSVQTQTREQVSSSLSSAQSTSGSTSTQHVHAELQRLKRYHGRL